MSARKFAAQRSFVTSVVRFSERRRSKLFESADQAVADVKSGSVVLSSGFGLCGIAGLFSFWSSVIWHSIDIAFI
jgi:3-oxoacid CoA-transferase